MAGSRKGAPPPKKACCLVSELLEELGLDRARARELQRQVLQGVMLMCQWQLERLDAEAPRPRRKARRVDLD